MIRLFIFTAIFVFYSPIFSQEVKWQLYPSLGIDMGGAIPVPLSKIPDGVKGTPKLTPNLGLGTQYSLNDKWNIAFDISYHTLLFTASADVRSQEFFSDDGQSVLYFSGETHSKVEIRFAGFPISAFYKLNENWSLIMGAYYSFVLEGSFETEGSDGWISDDKSITDNALLPGIVNTSYNFNDNLDNFDLGGLIGYQYKITPRILFWGRFYIGMKSIFKPEFQNISYEMYQMRLSTGISYVFFNR
jgi:hypothetical protein